MSLTPKQILFVKHYVLTKNATASAKLAGYSEKTAHSTGPRMLANAGVAAEIDKAFKAQTTKLERKARDRGMTKERWLEELRAIALANIDDLVTIENVKVGQGKRGKTYSRMEIRATATADRPRRLGRAIRKIAETKNGIAIEMHSKQAALDTIGRSYGWVKDAVDLNLPQVDSVQVILTLPSNGREAPAEPTQPIDDPNAGKGHEG